MDEHNYEDCMCAIWHPKKKNKFIKRHNKAEDKIGKIGNIRTLDPQIYKYFRAPGTPENHCGP